LKLHRYAERIDSGSPGALALSGDLTWLRISPRRWLTALEDAIENMVAPPGRSYPEHQLERGELQHVIRQAIDSLSPSQKIVIVLHYLADLNLKEIADILEVPEGTIKSRLYYGRENLRRKLASSRVMSPEVSYEFT
jgi:RNA polymerase sigma-70 factor (ECF subfamily)